MAVAYFFLVFSFLNYAFCQDQCVVYEFEENVQDWLSESSACAEHLPWTQGSYDTTDIISLNPLSNSFISPDPTPDTTSCATSFIFTIQNSGTLELNIYAEANPENVLTISFYRESDPNVLFTYYVSIINSGFQSVYISMLNVASNGPFQGYFTLIGRNSAESKLLVDSFRYIPQGMVSASDCTLYSTTTTTTTTTTSTSTSTESTPSTTSTSTESTSSTTSTSTESTPTTPTSTSPSTETTAIEMTTTEIPTTEPPSTETTNTEAPTTEAPTTEIASPNGCVVYQFGLDFYETFNSDGVCTYMYDWDLRNYTTFGIESPHTQSFSYIAPLNLLSCTASFVFSMANQGVLEVNVFVDRFMLTDYIDVIVYELTNGGGSKIVGIAEYNPKQPNFVFGWNTLQINISGTEEFDGYFAIIGNAAYNSVLLVDSFKYVPPSTSSSECRIYE